MVVGDERQIAIVGMACRFPGADDPATYWQNLRSGTESVTFFSEEDLRAAGISEATFRNPNYVPAAPIINGVDLFDASFFEYSPREATLMDPSHRLFLEVAWEAFEDAGILPGASGQVAGVFAGAGGVVTSYLVDRFSSGNASVLGATGGLEHLGNDKDFLATRASFKLNLKGPSITVQTACSTSLVALHLACQSIHSGECDLALAGGATVRCPQTAGYTSRSGDILSPDGHCRAFDAEAQGTIFGSGVGAVLLQPLDQAVAAGARIYAVIRGTAINNDGAEKISYTASSVAGQSRAMVEALTLAEAAAGSISYVECHGTGTILGDPLEIQALSRAFRVAGGSGVRSGEDGPWCGIGSVKSNIGHLEQAAGVAAVIKTALALFHKEIPPTLNFERPNPKINLTTSPFYVATALHPWATRHDLPRRACVNSLGLGGTNAFAVLEEPPEPARPESRTDRPLHLFTLSGKDPAALDASAARYRERLPALRHAGIGDICHTAAAGRVHFAARYAAVVESVEDLERALAQYEPPTDPPASAGGKGPVFLFSGQGSQYGAMASGLYEAHPVFRKALDRCNALLGRDLQPGLLDVLYDPQHQHLVDTTAYTQPILVALQYALAELWRSCGVVPAAVMGHSIGEFAAACVAGAMGLEDTLRLVARRGAMMDRIAEPGSMVAVQTDEAALEPLLAPAGERVCLAASNAPLSLVIAGDAEAVGTVVAQLERSSIPHRRLRVSQAFHSPLIEPILDELESAAAGISFKAPRVDLISNVTGEKLATAPSARYWRQHARSTVRFAAGMRTLYEQGHRTFLEIGPAPTLVNLGRQCLPGADCTWLPSLRPGVDDWEVLLGSLRTLFLQGHPIDWTGLDQPNGRRTVSLPTYPFQRKRHWLPDGAVPGSGALNGDVEGTSLVGRRLRSSLPHSEFESVYATDRQDYLVDHQIFGRVVLPLTAALVAGVGSGRDVVGGASLEITDLAYREAMIIPLETGRLVHLLFQPKASGDWAYQLNSTADGGGDADAWRTHVTARVRPVDTNGSRPSTEPTLADIRKRCSSPADREHYYATLRTDGIDYGPAFQGVQELWSAPGEALGRVVLPAGVASDEDQLHPALLDACLHLYPAVADPARYLSAPAARRGAAEPFDDGKLCLPITLSGFRIFKPGARSLWAHATGRGPVAPDGTVVVDITCFEPDGSIAARFEGLSVRPLGPRELAPDDASHLDWVYELAWVERPPPEEPAGSPDRAGQFWLIFGDGQGLGNAVAGSLRELGAESRVVLRDEVMGAGDVEDFGESQRRIGSLIEQTCRDRGAAFTGVVYLWGLDTGSPGDEASLERDELAVTGGALGLFKGLVAARASHDVAPRVWMLTRGAQLPPEGTAYGGLMQSPLWGLGRSVRLEQPKLWGGLIDLEPSTQRSSHEEAAVVVGGLLDAGAEDQVALRGTGRFAPRLVRSSRDRDAAPADGGLPLNAEGSYLITGGLGSLGRKLADWMVAQGARHLAVTSRRPADAEAESFLQGLRDRGCNVALMVADVTHEDDVRGLVARLRAELPPLKGVIHSAGMLRDGVLDRMSWEDFTAVTSPKIKGSWLLHEHTRDLDLDFFVLFSSVLSIMGAAGQINYTAGNAFVDALAAHRRAAGLPAAVINWGPWAGTGLATDSGKTGEAIWRRRGTEYLPADGAMSVFEHLMATGKHQAFVSITRWPAFLRDAAPAPALYAELEKEAAGQLDGAVGKPADTRPLQRRLAEAAPGDRRGVAIDFVAGLVADLLGVEGAVNTRQSLAELGLDSLMAVNLVNRLEDALKKPVPTASLLQGPSVEQLVSDLLPDLGSEVEDLPGPEGAGVPELEDAGVPADIPRPAGPSATPGRRNPWLVTVRANPQARVRLFCFPFAGGGSAFFRAWSEALDPSIEVVAIEPPGRLGRIDERPIRDISTFVGSLVPGLTGMLEDKPFAFFGHCLGGLTMFEVTRHVMDETLQRPTHVFASGTRTPDRLVLTDEFERALMEDVLRNDGFVVSRALYEQDDAVFADGIRHFNIDATESLLADPSLRSLLLPTIRAEFEMAYRYRFRPTAAWDVPIICFAGSQDTYATRDDMLEWRRFTASSFQLFLRQGAHFLLVDDKPFLHRIIARELASVDADMDPAAAGQRSPVPVA